uniref:Uncharacterized protein n=1 Tax=Rhizophora mucronata TaxID=61149 RepID=A0A2P2PLS9_RHIMU
MAVCLLAFNASKVALEVPQKQ